LREDNFFLRGGALSTLEGISKLINGSTLTNDENNMWFTYMPEPPKCLEIGVLLDSRYSFDDIGYIYVWNYNKSLLESVKGIKEIEILWEN
jgi:protein JBTS26